MHISIYRDRINNQIHRPCSTAGGYLSLAIDTCIGECNITFIIDAEIDIGLSLQLRHFMFMYYKKCVCVVRCIRAHRRILLSLVRTPGESMFNYIQERPRSSTSRFLKKFKSTLEQFQLIHIVKDQSWRFANTISLETKDFLSTLNAFKKTNRMLHAFHWIIFRTSFAHFLNKRYI